MAGPEDLGTQLNGQMALLTNQINTISMNFNKSITEGLNTANAMAPHNVLGSMFKGSGQFTAKTPTQKLQSSNIF